MKHKRRGLGLIRHRSLRVFQRDECLLPRIQALKTEHPFWGYRQIWTSLRFVDQQPIKKKRVLQLMLSHQLPVQPNRQLKAKRTSTRNKPKPTKPH